MAHHFLTFQVSHIIKVFRTPKFRKETSKEFTQAFDWWTHIFVWKSNTALLLLHLLAHPLLRSCSYFLFSQQIRTVTPFLPLCILPWNHLRLNQTHPPCWNRPRYHKPDQKCRFWVVTETPPTASYLETSLEVIGLHNLAPRVTI